MTSRFTSLKKTYLTEVGESLSEISTIKTEYYTENDFSILPEPVQKYFSRCGYIGKEKIDNIRIDYDNSFIKMSPEKNWLRIRYFQTNFSENPTRLALITSKIIGVFPFEGRDKYQNGQGNMLIKLFKLFTVADAKGKEMDESALVTLLSEVLFMPNLALKNQITWNAIDNYSVEASIKDKENMVSGIFHFNSNHDYIRFSTSDRYYSYKDGSYKKIKWSCEFENYQSINGILFPTYVKAIWHMDDKSYEYFKAQIKNVQHNINLK